MSSRMKSDKIKPYTIAFLLGAIVGLLIVLPFYIKGNGIFYLGSDFVEQEITFWTYCNQAIKSGNIFYTSSVDLGYSFIGLFSYYGIGSPFFWLSLLIPATRVYKFIGLLLVLKMAVATTTAFAYARQYVQNINYAIIAGLMYAFCGYQISNMNFFHFYDVTALFPLLLLCLDLTVKKDKKCVFAIMVALSLMCNFVFFVGEVVFLIIYFLVKLICKEYRLNVKKFFQLVFESLLGVGMACIILIPGIVALMNNPRVSQAGYEHWYNYIFLKPIYWAEIIRSALFPAECIFDRGFYLQGFTNGAELYLPLFGVVLVFAFIFTHKNSWQSMCLKICGIFAIIPILNSAFVAFNSEYYTRWYYMPLLICAVISAQVLQDQSIKIKSGIKAYIFFWIMLGVVFLTFTYYYKVTFIYNIVPVVMYVFVSLSGFAVTILTRKIQNLKNGQSILLILTAIFCVASSDISTYYHQRTRTPQDVKNYYTLPEQIGSIQMSDSFRINSNYYFMNLGTVLDKSTVTSFRSNISPYAQNFYKEFNIPRSVITMIDNDDKAMKSFLGARYWFTLNGESMADNDDAFTNIFSNGSWTVDEFKYALPMGVKYDKYVTASECEHLGKSEKEKVLFQALILEDESRLTSTMEHADINFDADYTDFVDALQNDSCDNFEYNNNGFVTTFKSNSDDIIMFTIPYDKGWKCKVNGVDTQIYKADYGFMAIGTCAGINNIEFVYRPVGLKLGTVISLVTLAVFLTYSIHCCKKKKLCE